MFLRATSDIDFIYKINPSQSPNYPIQNLIKPPKSLLGKVCRT